MGVPRESVTFTGEGVSLVQVSEMVGEQRLAVPLASLPAASAVEPGTRAFVTDWQGGVVMAAVGGVWEPAAAPVEGARRDPVVAAPTSTAATATSSGGTRVIELTLPPTEWPASGSPWFVLSNLILVGFTTGTMVTVRWTKNGGSSWFTASSIAAVSGDGLEYTQTLSGLIVPAGASGAPVAGDIVQVAVFLTRAGGGNVTPLKNLGVNVNPALVGNF